MNLQQVGATREDAAAMLQANMEVDVSDLLPLVKCPTLVVHATGDQAVPFELGREIAGGIPNARFVPIESERHVVAEEAAAQARNAVIEFLQEEEETAAGAAEEARRRAARAQPAAVHTILFTDIESSTALTQRLGDAKAQELLRAHNTIVRDALKTCGGSEVKHTGDGIMASFPSASRALECAIAIQRAVAALRQAQGGQAEPTPGQAEPVEAPLRLRIGLNAGEPVAEEDPDGRADLFGASVQLARRVCDHAGPGQIVASNVVRELATGKGFLFSDLGDVVPKGFEDPVKLWEVRWREEG